MFDMLKVSWNDKLWRLSIICILLWGVAVAALSPYLSIIGIERLGLSDLEFAIFSTLSAIITVAASLFLGVYSDQTGRYREVLLGSIFMGGLGGAIMYFAPHKLTFIITLLLVIPLASSSFTQFFALAKLAANKNKALDPDFVSSAARAGFAGAFAVAPPIWAIMLATGVDIFVIYGASAIIHAIIFVLVLTRWPKEQKKKEDVNPKMSFGAALGELARPKLAIRLVLIATIGSVTMLNATVMGLIFVNNLGGSETDVGIFAGAVALIEVPIMLMST